MAKVTIVGAGQSGLQLGIGLVQAGHDVRLVSNRTPEDFRHGKACASFDWYQNYEHRGRVFKEAVMNLAG